MVRRRLWEVRYAMMAFSIATVGCGGAISRVPRASHDYALQQRVERAGQRLLAATGQTNAAYWHFSVYDDPAFGAVVAKNGSVAVEAGLARRLHDDELTALLAHETSHVFLEHADDRSNAFLLATLIASGATTGLLLATDIPGWGGVLTFFGLGFASIVPLTAYGRSLEDDADEYGLRLLCRAGYRSDAVVRALTKTRAYFAEVLHRDEYTGILATHPETDARIANIRAAAPRYCPNEVPLHVQH